MHPRNPVLSQIEEYPVFMQTLVLTRGRGDGAPGNDEINVNSVEGQTISRDVSMSRVQFRVSLWDDCRDLPPAYRHARADTSSHGRDPRIAAMSASGRA